jgi:hypothetical protein
MGIPIGCDTEGIQMADLMSEDHIRRLQTLMNGSSIDKDRAEVRLKECDPCALPEAILESWVKGSMYDKFRAGRVKEAWSKRTQTVP